MYIRVSMMQYHVHVCTYFHSLTFKMNNEKYFNDGDKRNIKFNYYAGEEKIILACKEKKAWNRGQ